MKIIDKETGKRLDKLNPDLKKTDPLKRKVEKGLEKQDELSPMDPPSAYDENNKVSDIGYDDMSPALKQLMDEHREVLESITAFEEALRAYKAGGYQLTQEINEAFGNFFETFDHKILPHNSREEKALFPLLHGKLVSSGEHSTGEQPKTAVDLMEDDHVKFIQLATLTFNFLGLASRIHDERSRLFVLDTAYDSGRELIELLKLHIFREDNVLFPIAQKLMNEEEFSEVAARLANMTT